MSVVPGFKYDLFVSYAHQNDRPWQWATQFIQTLQEELKGKSRDFNLWWDPGLRTGENFDVAIAEAISESAVFLSILSPAYGDSTYCRREVEQFRQQLHPAFGLLVGSMSRMQGIVIDREFTKDRWAPELRNTSPQEFFDGHSPLFSRPAALDATDPWVQGLWKVRDSVWAILQMMREQKQRGDAIERSYGSRNAGIARTPTVFLAEVTDDLDRRREALRVSSAERGGFEVKSWSEPAAPVDSGVNTLSVHLFGKYPGRIHSNGLSLPQLQLRATLDAKPARRPLVWIARDLNLDEIDSPEHRQFVDFLIASSEVETLRTDFEDLKEEVAKRMRPAEPSATKSPRQNRESPIIHIWHAMADPVDLQPLKQFLNDNDCGISVFQYNAVPPEKLQSRLAVCDGLIVPYTTETRTWAEDVMTEAFRLRRREERPTAFAAVELPPGTSDEFNFEHPRVVPIHVRPPQGFGTISEFLARLESAGG